MMIDGGGDQGGFHLFINLIKISTSLFADSETIHYLCNKYAFNKE